MHALKLKAPALGNMLHHYERDREATLERENIDRERTSLNYNLAPARESTLDFINRRIEELALKRAPRKDAVRMVDICLTLPDNDAYSGREKEFFRVAYQELEKQFGAENVVSAYVHMDEATPHMHFAFVPITKNGRLSAKDVLNRKVLNNLHPQMEHAMCSYFGVKHAGVLLDDERRQEKRLSKLSQEEYKQFQAAKAQLVHVKAEVQELEARKESLRREVNATERVAEASVGELLTLASGRGLRSREQAARATNSELKSTVTRLEGFIKRAQAYLASVPKALRSAQSRFKVRLAQFYYGSEFGYQTAPTAPEKTPEQVARPIQLKIKVPRERSREWR